MRRLLHRLGLLASPVLLLAALELAAPEMFTFRSWEALRITPNRLVDEPCLARLLPYTTLPGPFLPEAHVSRTEQGDLGHHTRFAERHAADWITDEYGFRITPSSAPPDLIVVGDSNVVGSGSAQRDTLVEILRAEHGVQAYPFAPMTIGEFLAEPRFRQRPPPYVVLAWVERNVLDDFQVLSAPPPSGVRWIRSPILRHAEFAALQLARMNALEFLRARLNDRSPPIAYGDMLFLQGPAALVEPEPARVETAIVTISEYARAVRARGSRFAVLIIPNKETIYSDLIRDGAAPRLVSKMTRALRERGVEALDIESALRESRAKNLQPYFRDDTHWNGTGARIAAAAISRWVVAGATAE